MTKENIFVKNKQTEREIIPIFFATDDNYVPYLTVAIRSLVDNSSKNYFYQINILTTGLNDINTQILNNLQTENVRIDFVNVYNQIIPIIDDLGIRDYYSITTYYRFFIATLFKDLHKALYLDCDIVILDDIAKLYKINLGNKILGACLEQIVASTPIFRQYTQEALNLNYKKYFNAGILVMNLDEFRKNNIKDKFIETLCKYKFDTIAQDQDYLNYLCKDKVKQIEIGWNKECIKDNFCKKPKLIHYAYFKKPWTDFYVKYNKYFWFYAKKTVFYNQLLENRENFPNEQRKNREIASKNLLVRARKIIKSNYHFCSELEKVNHSIFNLTNDRGFVYAKTAVSFV